MRGTTRLRQIRRRGVSLASGGAEQEPQIDDAMARAVARDQTDFESMRRLLAFSLAPGDSCIDIGAHRGAVLAEMCRVAPAGRHLAFEPIPQLAAYLRETFPQVEVHEAALAAAAGRSSFAHVRGSAEGWSGLRFRPLPTGQEADVEQLDVEVEVLDEVLDPDFRPRVIKIDVEGAEEGVLRGAMTTLNRHRPIVIFEHGSGSAEEYGTTPAAIHALLRDELGYRVFDLDGNGPYTPEDFERVFASGERVNFVTRP